MSKDQMIGAALLLGSIAGIVIYGWLLFSWPTLILQVTAFLVVTAVLGVIGWIGYTLATTPPPVPMEDMEKELDKSISKETDATNASV